MNTESKRMKNIFLSKRQTSRRAAVSGFAEEVMPSTNPINFANILSNVRETAGMSLPLKESITEGSLGKTISDWIVQIQNTLLDAAEPIENDGEKSRILAFADLVKNHAPQDSSSDEDVYNLLKKLDTSIKIEDDDSGHLTKLKRFVKKEIQKVL